MKGPAWNCYFDTINNNGSLNPGPQEWSLSILCLIYFASHKSEVNVKMGHQQILSLGIGTGVSKNKNMIFILIDQLLLSKLNKKHTTIFKRLQTLTPEITQAVFTLLFPTHNMEFMLTEATKNTAAETTLLNDTMDTTSI